MPQLITPAYVEEQHRLHSMGTGAYGDRGFNWAYVILGIAMIERCNAVLDYGCGKGSLSRALRKIGWQAQEYDPGVEQYAAQPKPADLVVSLDVLEHIEPELLDNVLDHVRDLTRKILFVAIATRPAKRFLTDGRNAHLIVEDGETWWRPRFEERGFDVRRVWLTGVSEWVAMMQKREK